MIYLTATGQPPGDNSTVHIYTQKIHTTTQNKNTYNNTKQKIHTTTQKLGMQAVPRLCWFYPGICLKTEEKARKTLSQGSHICIFTMITISLFIFSNSTNRLVFLSVTALSLCEVGTEVLYIIQTNKAGFSPGRPGFIPIPFHVRFVVQMWYWNRLSPQSLQFSLASNVTLMLHTTIHMLPLKKEERGNLENFQKAKHF